MSSINLFTLSTLSYLNKEGLNALWKTSTKAREQVRNFDERHLEWQQIVLRVLDAVKLQFESVLDEGMRDDLRRHAVFYPERMTRSYAPIQHIAHVTEELRGEAYTPYEKQLILRALLSMTLPLPPSGVYVAPPKELAEFSEGIVGKGTIHVMYTNEIGVLVRNRKMIAKVMPLEGTLLQKANPGVKIYAANTINTVCAAFETTRALGIERVAPTMRLKNGSALQHFYENSRVLEEVFETEGAAEKLLGFNPIKIHLHVLASLLSGRRDGHSNNTIFTPDNFYDIDEEQNFSTRSCIGLKRDYVRACEGQGPLQYFAGLPQCGIPLSPAVKRLFGGWFGWKDKCIKVLQRNGLEDPFVTQAFQERCCRIRALCMTAHASVRDAYFALHGKDYLFQRACIFQVPPTLFFGGGVEHYDDQGYDAVWKPADESITLKNYLALAFAEKMPMITEITMGGFASDQYPGDTLHEDLNRKLWRNDTVECMEIPKGTFNEELYAQLCANHPEASPAFHSYLLSLCLEGFPKRMSRQFAEPGMFLSLMRLEVNTDLTGRQSLLMHSHPIIREVNRVLRSENVPSVFPIMELSPEEFSLSKYENLQRKTPEANSWDLIDNCLLGNARILGNQIQIVWGRFGTVEAQKKDNKYYLVFAKKS